MNLSCKGRCRLYYGRPVVIANVAVVDFLLPVFNFPTQVRFEIDFSTSSRKKNVPVCAKPPAYLIYRTWSAEFVGSYSVLRRIHRGID